MNLPFTYDQFIAVFRDYNLSVWPMQIVLNAVGIGIITLLWTGLKQKSRIISILLSLFWGWAGIVYHMMFFSTINPAARIFGALFIVQALVFLIFGGLLGKIEFRKLEMKLPQVTGLILILYAMVIYPLLGIVLGHTYPASPTFGLPCPVTIFTIGLLFLATPMNRLLLIIPFVWSMVGGSAAFKLGIREDIGLLISGLLLATLFFTHKNQNRKEQS